MADSAAYREFMASTGCCPDPLETEEPDPDFGPLAWVAELNGAEIVEEDPN